jgi:hypothetical protein
MAKNPRFQTSANPSPPAVLDAPFSEGETLASRIVRDRVRVTDQLAEIEEVRLRRRALSQGNGPPFADEFMRCHGLLLA